MNPKCSTPNCAETATLQLLGKHPICRKCGDEKNRKSRLRSAKRRAEGHYSPSIKVRWSDAKRIFIEGPPIPAPIPMNTDPKIKSHGRRMIKLSSLRPGSWLQGGPLRKARLVIANFPSKSELKFHGCAELRGYGSLIIFNYTHLGTGQRRRWLRWLPKWVRSWFCEWSKP